MSSNSCCISRKVSLFLAGLLMAAAAHASDWHTELPQAKPIGHGELSWFGLSIYTATLWSDHVPFNEHAAFALQLTYHRHISGERIVQTSMKEIERLSDHRFSADQLQHWATLMSRAFPDVNDGDQLVGIFIPGHGCRFYGNHGQTTDISDVDFAQAFFNIWLDPRSKDSALRASLLGLPQ